MYRSHVTLYPEGREPRVTCTDGALRARRRGMHETTDLWLPLDGEMSARDVGDLLAHAYALRPPLLQAVAARVVEERCRVVAQIAEGRFPSAPDTSPRPRSLALARLILEAARARGLALPASEAAADALAAGSLHARHMAEAATSRAPADETAALAARFVARLVSHAFVPLDATEILLRSTAAVLGQLGVAGARAQVDRAWSLDAS